MSVIHVNGDWCNVLRRETGGRERGTFMWRGNASTVFLFLVTPSAQTWASHDLLTETCLSYITRPR